MKKIKTPTNHNQFVRSIEQLIDLTRQNHHEYAMILGGAGLYSRKFIDYNPKTKIFKITNCIDNTKQKLTHKQLLNTQYTLIGAAMPARSLIALID